MAINKYLFEKLLKKVATDKDIDALELPKKEKIRLKKVLKESRVI